MAASQLPGADPYAQYAALRTAAYGDAVSNIQNRRSDLLRQAGLAGEYGQDGQLSGYHVASGPGSEFGGYQMTMKGLAGQGEGLDAERAGLGFGGGLSQQMADLGHQNDAQTYNDFASPVLQGIAGLGAEQVQTTDQYNQDLFDQMHGGVQQGVQNGDYTTADFSNVPNPGYGKGGANPTGKNPSGLPKRTTRPTNPRRRRR